MKQSDTIIGYVLGGHDINAYFFEDAPRGVVCPKCNSCLDRSYVPKNIRIHRSQKYGFGDTLDLQPLFSKEFVDAIERVTKQKLDAAQVSTAPDFYHVRIHDVVEFDTIRRKSEAGERCSTCGNFKYFVGATPAFLKCNSLKCRGIFRTNMEFGGSNGKSCLIILGKSLKREIEQMHFRSVYFVNAYGLNAVGI
jgi:hypothetical protein